MNKHMSPALAFSTEAVDLMMPLHLRLDSKGQIRGLGSTLARLLPRPVLGLSLVEVFDLRRPSGLADAQTLVDEHERARCGRKVNRGRRAGADVDLRLPGEAGAGRDR